MNTNEPRVGDVNMVNEMGIEPGLVKRMRDKLWTRMLFTDGSSWKDDLKEKDKDSIRRGDLEFIKIADVCGPHHEERAVYLRERVKWLQRQPQPKQRSPEWYTMRDGMITASDWGAVIKRNCYTHKNSVVYKKCGHPGYNFKGNQYTEWGKKYEDVAVKIYESRNMVRVLEFGVLKHPDFPFLGASPDGITECGIMVEIKCPPRREITGEIPEHYWCQIQGQLEVCDLDRCDFLECRIAEYPHVDDYISEQYFQDRELTINHTSTGVSACGSADGNESVYLGSDCGAVMVFADKVNEELVYRHSKLGIRRHEFDHWMSGVLAEMQEINADLEHTTTTFWYLEKVSCVPVFRDKAWFYQYLPRLRQCWEDILFYRQIGYEKLLNKPVKVGMDASVTDMVDAENEAFDTNRRVPLMFSDSKPNVGGYSANNSLVEGGSGLSNTRGLMFSDMYVKSDPIIVEKVVNSPKPKPKATKTVKKTTSTPTSTNVEQSVVMKKKIPIKEELSGISKRLNEIQANVSALQKDLDRIVNRIK